MQLRAAVIESEILLQSNLSYMIGIASLYSHPNADVEKGSVQLNTLFTDALAAVRYMTGGMTGKDRMDEERNVAIAQYKQWQVKLERPTDGDKPVS